MSNLRAALALQSRIAVQNPDATDEELQEFFAQAAGEGRFDNPYGTALDEDEPRDHAFNDRAPWSGEFERENFHCEAGGFNSGDED